MLRVNNKGLMPRGVSMRSILAAIIFALAGPVGASAYSTAALKDKDVQKAEKIIAKLHRLEAVTASHVDFRAYKTEIKGLYPELFAKASELSESDLKTDLTTAVFLYETAYRTGLDLSVSGANCDVEVRETYLKLCRESRDRNPTRLLWSKARLHTKWGEAVIRSYRGASDHGTLKELSHLEAERKVDIILAEQALASLSRLAGMVEGYSTGEAFEAALRAKRISFEQLSQEISESVLAVDQALASMPRGRLHLLLSNARSSYRDGLFWWGKVNRVYAKTVSVNNLASAEPLKLIGLPSRTVSGTVLANWKSALRYTREAEKALSALQS